MKYSGMHGTIRKHFNSREEIKQVLNDQWIPKELPEEANDVLFKILALQQENKGVEVVG